MDGQTGLIFDERFLEHQIEPGHPESPARLRAISRKLDETGLRSHLRPIPLPASSPAFSPASPGTAPATGAAADREADAVRQAIRAIHSEEHTASILSIPVTGTISRLAVAGSLAAVDAVCRGEVRNAFCAVRPPGHHAHDLGDEEGFCYFNNIAVAARHAQKAHGCAKVLIIDWDYHHGNGTEDAFYDDPTVLFFSTHKWRAYPGTGNPSRQGAGEGHGFNVNVDLPSGARDQDILLAWERHFLPKAEAFAPDLVLISAGFDSRRDDWLGDFNLTDDAFRRMTRMAGDLAAKSARGRMVSFLEGGYNPEGLASGVASHLGEMVSS